MPVILKPGNYDLWLDPGFTDVALVAECLKPFDPGLMKKYPASTRRVFAAIADGAEWPDSWRQRSFHASYHAKMADKRQLALLRSWSHEEAARAQRTRRFEHSVQFVDEKRMDSARSASS